jgi:hypothetical protein
VGKSEIVVRTDMHTYLRIPGKKMAPALKPCYVKMTKAWMGGGMKK